MSVAPKPGVIIPSLPADAAAFKKVFAPHPRPRISLVAAPPGAELGIIEPGRGEAAGRERGEIPRGGPRTRPHSDASPTLPSVDAILETPPAAARRLAVELAARLEAARQAANAAPALTPVLASPEERMLTDVRDVAALVHRSPSWVRKHGHTLPGFHQPGGPGTRVSWRESALRRWAGLVG